MIVTYIVFFEYHDQIRRTRITHINLLKEPAFKKAFQRRSVSCRCVKRFNSLSKSGINDENFENLKPKEIAGFYHKLRESVLLNNACLVNSISK